jgi:hypothetical protein
MCRAVFERHLKWPGTWTKKEKKSEGGADEVNMRDQ